METKEYYGGTYPEPPEPEFDETTIKVVLTLETYITIQNKVNQENVEQEVKEAFRNHYLFDEACNIEVEDYEVC